MSATRPYRVLFAASEVVGFAKTGGLADVAGALPRALAQRGHLTAVTLPLYGAVRRGGHRLEPTGIEFTFPIGQRSFTGRVLRSVLPGCEVPAYLIEQPELFERDDSARGAGIYNFTGADGRKHDYPDNAERFVFFNRAVIETLPRLNPTPEILHCNDWQTGLLPVYLREWFPHRPVKTLLTIHNIAYQGQFSAGAMEFTGLPHHLFHSGQLEFHGQMNLLKSGCAFADLLNTVSPRYAHEIQTPEFGCGLEGILAQRRGELSGIVNGVDYGEWDPRIDRHLVQRYDIDSVVEGKAACKQALQHEMRLPLRPSVPLLAIVARLVDQKGVDLVLHAAHELLAADLQLVVLGEGDPLVHEQLRRWQSMRPQKFGLRIGFDEGLAHRIEAGADVFLMPSRYEPSGLNQLYSLRYGTVPVVRAVGGLADTITDATPQSLAAGEATGFRFHSFDVHSFSEAVWRALTCWQNDRAAWHQIVRTGMRQDWSWNRSAGEYERLYSRLVG